MDMGTQGAGRKRLPNRERLTAEDDALNQIAREVRPAARYAGKRGRPQLSGAGSRSVRPRGRGRGRGPRRGPLQPRADPLAPGTGRGHRPLPQPPTPLGCCPLGSARSWGAAPGAQWPGLAGEGGGHPFVVLHRGGAVGLTLEACERPQRPHGPGEIARPLSVTICRGLSPRVQLGHEPGVVVTLVSGGSLRTGPGTLRLSPVCQQSVL